MEEEKQWSKSPDDRKEWSEENLRAFKNKYK